MIDHEEVRELLELAAVEPDGLDRLSAGDTPEAAALAGHLAGCLDCMDEARRLAAAAPIVRDVVATIPPDALRGRTLALVREVGRSRRPASPPASVGTPVPSAIARRRRRFAWPVALAAAVILSLVVGGEYVGIRSGQDLHDQQARTAMLATLHEATLRLTGEPDARRVALTGIDPTIVGTLIFSSSTRELVVSATGLPKPAAGQEFACWLTAPNGSRVRMGRMNFGGGLAFWAGWADELAAAGTGTQFGVTLVDASGVPIGADLLVGSVTGD